MSEPIDFLLNDHRVSTTRPAGMLVLDFLRSDRRLMGSKEGCKEGDCGACVVLIGSWRDGSVDYKPVTSCLMPLGELHGKHLVTIEGLNGEALTPVQQAIVDEGASQCGFCTPGIVVSLTALLLDRDKVADEDGVKYALSGHLCRCTGYRSLKNGAEVLGRLETGMNNGGVEPLITGKVLPPYFREIPQRLQALQQRPAPEAENQDGVAIAGGTDLYVQIGEEIAGTQVQILDHMETLKGIAVAGDRFHIGAAVTFEAFADHPAIRRIIPGIKDHMSLNASWQIRNRATLGGNIINASPIGDMTCLLIALDAHLNLETVGKSRTVALHDFFLGYKDLDKTDDEILRVIGFSWPGPDTHVHFEKVSKRKHLDIATVNSAIRIQHGDGLVRSARIAMGGVAPIPLYLAETSAWLAGRPVTAESVRQAAAITQQEIAPISDIRGSAAYKRLLARQLVYAHFITLFPQEITFRELYEAH